MSKQVVTRSPAKGRVISVSKDKKTAKIELVRVVSYPKYGKYIHRSTHVFADCVGFNELSVGYEVSVLPCRPVSKTKFWRVCSVIK